MDDIDKQIIERLAAVEGMGVHKDAVYTPPDGGASIQGVYVIVDDLRNELDGVVTQGGALLSLLRSQVGTPTQDGTVEVDGTTWKIGRRRPSNDPSMVAVEAHR